MSYAQVERQRKKPIGVEMPRLLQLFVFLFLTTTTLFVSVHSFSRVVYPISLTNTRRCRDVSVFSAGASDLFSLSPPPSMTNAKQVLEFREPKTNVTVMLIGSMHYNPTSVALVADTVKYLGDRNMLASVLVESCDIRWNKTAEIYQKSALLKEVLKNEMRTAYDVAMSLENPVPVILGDQRINITSDALKDSLKQTLQDLTTPLSGGWGRLATEITQAWKETVPLGGEGYLNAYSFFDPRLWLLLPVSLVKYPLSYLVRDPIPTTIVLLSLFGISSYADDQVTLEALMTNEVPVSDLFASFAVAALETLVFARLLLKPLLAERNEILAQNILEQCKLSASSRVGSTNTGMNKAQGLFGFFNNNKKEFASSASPSSTSLGSQLIYAPGSPAPNTSYKRTGDENDSEKVVVAVLGMAHCNGIKKLLKEELV